jgi:hypothetical protein
MLPFGVTNPTTVLQRPEIPEGLINYHVYTYMKNTSILLVTDLLLPWNPHRWCTIISSAYGVNLDSRTFHRVFCVFEKLTFNYPLQIINCEIILQYSFLIHCMRSAQVGASTATLRDFLLHWGFNAHGIWWGKGALTRSSCWRDNKTENDLKSIAWGEGG